MNALKGQIIRRDRTADGPLADVLVIEPNGDSYELRCVCREDGVTEIGIEGNGDDLAYLNDRYGSRAVCEVVRQTALSFDSGLDAQTE